MDKVARNAARMELIQLMQRGLSWKKACQQLATANPPLKQAMAYRLLRRFETEQEAALVDNRHGYPLKLKGEALEWLLEYCRSHPHTSSPRLQALLLEKFQLQVSVSQLNRVRTLHQLTTRKADRLQPGGSTNESRKRA